MKDFNKPLRKAIFDALEGNIMYGSDVIHVHDKKQKKSNNNNIFVVIGSMSGSNNDSFAGWSRKITTTIDIVTKTGNEATTDIADDVANEILELLMPSVQGASGLVDTTDFQFINVNMGNDRYLELSITETAVLVRRLIDIEVTVSQK